MEFDQLRFEMLSPGAKQLFRAIQSNQKVIQRTSTNFATILGSDETIACRDALPLIRELVAEGFLIHPKSKQWQIPEELRNKSAFTG